MSAGTEVRPLPHNRDAELAILGSIFIDNKSIESAIQHVKPEAFLLLPDRAIFRAMQALHDTQKPIDLVTITDYLRGKGQLDEGRGTGVSGLTAGYISQLIDGSFKVSNVGHYAEIVAEKFRRREVIRIAQSFVNDAWGTEKSTPELLNEWQKVPQEGGLHSNSNGNGNGLHDYGLLEFQSATFPTPDHLVEGLIPRGGTALILALPHRLKSWFTTSLALAATRAGTIMGKLEVKSPVRTYLAQIEDFPGQLQWRIAQLLRTKEYDDIDARNVRILPRCNLNLMDETCFQSLMHKVAEFKADHVIIDVVRRVFRGDINSPKESAAFLEQIDRLREATGCAVTLVHHENKKDEEMMKAGAGSYTLPSWANVMMQFKRKIQEGNITHVEIEVDNKLAQSPEPMRMVLDLTSEMPLRIEALEDGDDWQRIAEQLGDEWTVKDFAEVLTVHRSNATRRLKKLIEAGRVEKVQSGKRGRMGGLARYRFLNGTENSEGDGPVVQFRRFPPDKLQ